MNAIGLKGIIDATTVRTKITGTVPIARAIVGREFSDAEMAATATKAV